jgi:sec-independent protein translocase protein TatA
MNTCLFAFIGMWETVAILAVVLVLFGAKKLPELARGLGTGIKEFRKATREVNEDLQKAFEEQDYHNPPARKIETPKTEASAAKPSDPKA